MDLLKKSKLKFCLLQLSTPSLIKEDGDEIAMWIAQFMVMAPSTPSLLLEVIFSMICQG